MQSPEGELASASPGLWVLSPDPRDLDSVMRAVEGTGTQVRILHSFPAPGEEDGPIHPDWFLCDLSARGVDVPGLGEFKRRHGECQLFLIAAETRGPVSGDLGRLGVRHWFVPPLDGGEWKKIFLAALKSRRAEITRQRAHESECPGFETLIGRSQSFLDACDLARRAAAGTNTVVLIEGETGTGKGRFARAIHRESPRSVAPFIEVNCASLPGSLLESELFGHEQGAFTHAQTAKLGLLELADSGTFFLDEVAETDLQVQAKILKFLDSGNYRRVGGIEERKVDVRVIAATQKDLEREARGGRFRPDLFHRLHVIRIRIPSLRERPGDVPILLGHYLDEYATKFGKPGLHLSEAAMAHLERQPWPGNVREIVNLCERVVLLSGEATEIGINDLPEPLVPGRRIRGERGENGRLRLEVPAGVKFDEIEQAAIEDALEKARGNVSAAASLLGMGRGQLRYRMERLGMAEEATQRRRPMRRRSGTRRSEE